MCSAVGHSGLRVFDDAKAHEPVTRQPDSDASSIWNPCTELFAGLYCALNLSNAMSLCTMLTKTICTDEW